LNQQILLIGWSISWNGKNNNEISKIWGKRKQEGRKGGGGGKGN
jgi:hypothetical protein